MPPFVKKFFAPTPERTPLTENEIQKLEEERNEKIKKLTNKFNAIITLRYMYGKETDENYGDLITESIETQEELRKLGVNIGEEIEA